MTKEVEAAALLLLLFFYFGLMFDDTLILHGVCGLQTMCPQYISLAKMGCHFGSRIRTLILQDQRLSKPTLHSLLISGWPLRQLRRCQFAHLIQYQSLCRRGLTCSARVSKLFSPRRAFPGSWPQWRARATPPWKTWLTDGTHQPWHDNMRPETSNLSMMIMVGPLN